MPRQKNSLEINTFVKGLVTEAGPLTFPENASLEDVNFVLNRDGSRQRRFGMDYEDNYIFDSLGFDISANKDYTINSTVWENAKDDGTLDIAVIQVGNRLWFFDNSASTISDAPLNGGSPLTISGGSTSDSSFASLQSRLIVSNGTQNPQVLSYNATSDVVSVSNVTLKTRDLFGVDDGLDVDERPTTLSSSHEWNLRNQGWLSQFSCAVDPNGSNASSNDPVSWCKSQGNLYDPKLGSKYPSNADILWASTLDTAGAAIAVGAFYPSQLLHNLFGTTQAPRGSAIIDVFQRGQSRKTLAMNILTSSASLPQDETQGSVSYVASYAGRIFYAIEEEQIIGGDNNSPKLGSMIFYSQVADTTDKLGKCYAEADPAAEDINDPIATDGGFITIPEAGKIQAMAPLANSLFIIADNGVWEVNGGDKGFSATEQSVNKITNIGALTTNSVVVSEDLLSYWSDGGIYVITIDDVSVKGVSRNITQTAIQQLYDDIPTTGKGNARGVYDSISRQVRWLYRDSSLPHPQFFNKELIYDLNLQAFYTSEIGVVNIDDGPFVAGYLDLPSAISNSVVTSITANSVPVTVNGDPLVATLRAVDESVKSSTKYLVFDLSPAGNSRFTFGGYNNVDFIDWERFNGTGVDAPARLLTGYLTGGVGSKEKKVSRLVVHCRRTEEGFTGDAANGLDVIGGSSCKVQSQWEWTNSAAAGRWGSEFQAYRLPRLYTANNEADPFDYSFTVVTTKSKLRGKGRALSLLFKTEPKKNLHIYGWGMELSSSNRM